MLSLVFHLPMPLILKICENNIVYHNKVKVFRVILKYRLIKLI